MLIHVLKHTNCELIFNNRTKLFHEEEHILRILHIRFPLVGESSNSGSIKNSVIASEADNHLKV